MSISSEFKKSSNLQRIEVSKASGLSMLCSTPFMRDVLEMIANVSLVKSVTTQDSTSEHISTE